MPNESLLSQYFIRSSNNYKTDRSHREAWCKACVDFTVRKIKHTDLMEGRPEREDSEVEKEGE